MEVYKNRESYFTATYLRINNLTLRFVLWQKQNPNEKVSVPSETKHMHASRVDIYNHESKRLSFNLFIKRPGPLYTTFTNLGCSKGEHHNLNPTAPFMYY